MATNPSTLPENSGRITPPDSAYPYGSAKNDSTGTAGDGTPHAAPRSNDTYGFYQWLLTQAGIVPSGNAETVLACQLGEALQTLFSQSGYIETVITSSDPAWTPDPRTKRIEFDAVGAGAGAGGTTGSASFSALGGGGGAGAGSLVRPSTVDATYAIVIGAGGVGGANGATDGTNGGATTITSSSLAVTCPGGQQGRAMTAAAGFVGALGGNESAVATGGTVNTQGDGGATGIVQNGTDQVAPGDGGGSIYGGAVRGRIGNPGGNAQTPGAGGSGAGSGVGDTSTYAGGDGANGQVLIREYF